MPHSKLNPQQLVAANHLNGPLVVFAGAGSGKTRVITHRIVSLIRDHGVSPWEILSMTFTNKAAAEMRIRALDLAPETKNVLITTFHSSCARWLREFAPELGYENNFVIFDDKDSTSLLKNLLKEAVPKKDLAYLVGQTKTFIQWAKTRAKLPNQLEDCSKFIKSKFPEIAPETYRRYQAALEEHNAMDFGDLLMNMLLLFRHNSTVRSIMSSRFRYIMVDEFQDTNHAQMELIKHLAQDSQNIFVVGDDDQSIYSWRGAMPANIINFNEHFSNVKTIQLQQNYRCTGNIVKAAAAVIENNQTRAPKTLYTENPPGEKIELINEKDSEMEASGIVSSIKSEKDQFPYADIAIFYRTNSQSRALEESLHRQKVPYKIFGSLAFYDRLEIKDILAYFRYLINPKDAISFKRLINTPPRGIGKKTQTSIEQLADQTKCSLFEAAQKFKDKPAVAKFIKLINDLEPIKTLPLAECLNKLESTIDYKKYLEKKYPDQFSEKLENIHELGSAMATAAKNEPKLTLGSWLESATLQREEHTNQPEGDCISLMTLHMAKGLEFNRVYLAGIEDGLLPHQNSLDDLAAIEEERRLLYVGMTRAKIKLSLYFAEVRQQYNQFNHNPPSRFLNEIPKDLIHPACIYNDTQAEETSEVTYDYEDFQSSQSICIGASVKHPTFGKGIVKDSVHNYGKTKIIVDFTDFGLKKVLATHLDLIVKNLS